MPKFSINKSYLTWTICIPILLASCSREESEGRIYSSACASRLSNGEVVECDPNEGNSENRRRLDSFLALDVELPGPSLPELPELDSQLNVFSVENIGILNLENGTKLQLAGVECSSEIDTYLEAMFLGQEPSLVLYLPTGLEVEGRILAYVWEYSVTPDPDFGPMISYSLLNELGISNEWCIPIQQEMHLYHQRFTELARLF